MVKEIENICEIESISINDYETNLSCDKKITKLEIQFSDGGSFVVDYEKGKSLNVGDFVKIKISESIL